MGEIVDIFRKPEDKKEKAEKKTEESFDFESIMEKNKKNGNRQAGERKKANRGVIRSYRLKH